MGTQRAIENGARRIAVQRVRVDATTGKKRLNQVVGHLEDVEALPAHPIGANRGFIHVVPSTVSSHALIARLMHLFIE